LQWNPVQNGMHIRLQTKCIIAVVLLQGLLISAILMMVDRKMQESMLDEFLRRATSNAEHLAAMSTDYITTDNPLGIQQSTVEAVDQNGWLYAGVLLPNGEWAALSISMEAEADLVNPSLVTWASGSTRPVTRYRLRRDSGGEIRDIAVPIAHRGARWATLCVGLSPAIVDGALLETRWSLFFWGTVGLVMGCLGAVVLARHITRPIDRLVRGVAMSGEDTRPGAIFPQDEVGHLRERFAALRGLLHEQLRTIHHTQSELESANQNLQHEVLKRQQAEEQLRQCRNDLAEQIADRTAALEAVIDRLRREITGQHGDLEALQQAREQADHDRAAKSQFLACMAQETLTPARNVLGMTELLLQSGLNETQRRYTQAIANASQTLDAHVHEMLDCANTDTGQSESAAVVFDLHGMVEETLQLFGERAARRGLDLGCWIDHNVSPWVRGDCSRLRQILIGLIGNAFQSTQRGDIAVSVKLSNPQEGHRHCQFTVGDAGMASDPQHQSRMREGFAQTRRSPACESGSSGLGLTVCRQFIEQLGGHMVMGTEPGRGASYSFTLPLEASADPKGTIEQPAVSFQGLRALIASSSRLMRTILDHHLRAWGITTAHVTSTAEAFAALGSAGMGNTPYHLLVLDEMLSPAEAEGLLRSFDHDPWLTKSSCILLTPVKVPHSPEGNGLKGRCRLVTKPFRRVELHACLLELTRATGADGFPALLPRPTIRQGATPDLARVLRTEDKSVTRQVAHGTT
jgi:signal transduction histidine kinase